MTTPLASIIIVARDEERNLQRCLEAVRSQRAPFDYELIVVDSGSRDRTAEVAKSFGARVIEIPRAEFQHGRTRQMASMQARGEFLVYLVADAVPADRDWLAALVDAVASDGRVAGAYSRQVPREGAGPIEAHRLGHRASSGRERVVKEIAPATDFWALAPEERFYFCEFDDVSCCRRRSLQDTFPIPAVDWAEDLVWAREVLLSGHRIVFEPRSVVRHSHADTLAHAFRRGWLDQAVVKRWFGVLYFDGVGALLRGYPRIWRDQARAIARGGRPLTARLTLLAWNSARLAAEMAGNYLAAGDPVDRHAAHDLARAMTRATLPMVEKSTRILRTRFTLGADTRPTLFMNPNSAAAARLHVPPGARLEFGAAINPAARGQRRDPVLFVVMVGSEALWHREIGPGARGEEPRWVEASVDLARFAGKRVTVMLATRSENTDYGWAGWGAPRIVTDALSAGDRLYNGVLSWAKNRVTGEPLRHP
ncbi:MAG TPA: glycosyltransferase family 2 protein [bacterium]|nr:glycosyltransferase family 2 protein [bacterium]